MSDEINKNVIDLFSCSKDKSHLVSDAQKKIRFYAGFNYVKRKKDDNGNPLRKDYLLKYASKCHYMVSVTREIDGETVLYTYDVPNDDLFKFMKSFDENTLDGVIVEIDKYFPDEIV